MPSSPDLLLTPLHERKGEFCFAELSCKAGWCRANLTKPNAIDHHQPMNDLLVIRNFNKALKELLQEHFVAFLSVVVTTILKLFN